MPGMYGEDDYDLAGFAVGIAEKSQIIDGSKVQEGDILLGLASSGIHSNGYSLVRRVCGSSGDALLPELNGRALKDVLLEPTRIYVQQVLPLVKQGWSMVLPILQAVVSSKIFPVCLRTTFQLKLKKIRFQSSQSLRPLKIWPHQT